jgi:hypothetical protein
MIGWKPRQGRHEFLGAAEAKGTKTEQARKQQKGWHRQRNSADRADQQVIVG